MSVAADQVREYSLTFHVPTLGMSLLPTERQGESGVSPCVVGLIQKPEVCTGVLPGDSVSRVNGVPLGGSTFNGRHILLLMYCVVPTFSAQSNITMYMSLLLMLSVIQEPLRASADYPGL